MWEAGLAPGVQFSEGLVRTCGLSKAENTRQKTVIDIWSCTEAVVSENIWETLTSPPAKVRLAYGDLWPSYSSPPTKQGVEGRTVRSQTF